MAESLDCFLSVAGSRCCPESGESEGVKEERVAGHNWDRLNFSFVQE